MILALFLAIAEAGKLSEGFRGLPFGSDTVLSKAPLEGCTREVQSPSDWSWMCRTELNGVPVIAMYATSYGYFYAVTTIADDRMTNSGGLLNAQRLREGAISAWGPGIQMDRNDFKSFPDWWWTDGSVNALMKYNPIKDQTVITIADLSVKKQRDLAAARAASGSNADF